VHLSPFRLRPKWALALFALCGISACDKLTTLSDCDEIVSISNPAIEEIAAARREPADGGDPTDFEYIAQRYSDLRVRIVARYYKNPNLKEAVEAYGRLLKLAEDTTRKYAAELAVDKPDTAKLKQYRQTMQSLLKQEKGAVRRLEAECR
jgi:hypothetical protein